MSGSVRIFVSIWAASTLAAPACAQGVMQQPTSSATVTSSRREFKSAPALAPGQQSKLPDELGPEEDAKLHARNESWRADFNARAGKPPAPLGQRSIQPSAKLQKSQLTDRSNATGANAAKSDPANLSADDDGHCATAETMPFPTSLPSWTAPIKRSYPSSLSLPKQQLQSWQLAPADRQVIQTGHGSSFAPRPFNFLQFSDSLRH